MIVIVETPRPDLLSIVPGACGAVSRCETYRSCYDAAIALLRRCKAEELRNLELHDLRQLKQRAAGVAPTERPKAEPVEAL